MIVELRTYKLKVGALEQYVRLYRERGYALQTGALGEPHGWYIVDGGALSTVVSLWRYASHEDRAQNRAKLAANKDWQAYLRDVSPLFESMDNQFLVPVQLEAEAAR